MTAVSTLDQLDWATCLDQEPGCESSTGCSGHAKWWTGFACGCGCLRCTPHKVEWLRNRSGDLERGGFQCGRCGVELIGSPEDALRVIPL